MHGRYVSVILVHPRGWSGFTDTAHARHLVVQWLIWYSLLYGCPPTLAQGARIACLVIGVIVSASVVTLQALVHVRGNFTIFF